MLPSVILLPTFVSSYLFKDSEYKVSCFQSGFSSYKKSLGSAKNLWHDATLS